MNPFVKFMASTTGRIVRIVAGVVLIVLGLLVMHGTDDALVPLRFTAPVYEALGSADRTVRLYPEGRPLNQPGGFLHVDEGFSETPCGNVTVSALPI